MAKAVALPDQPAISRDEEARFNALMRRADAGDPKALASLRTVLDSPEGREVWGTAGDLAVQAEASLIRAVAGKNAIVIESAERRLAEFRRELAGPTPTPLERLLVARIAACWLHLGYAETIYVQNMAGLTIPQADFHQRRIDHAHRRYLSAIKALAQVRRLISPIVQVNVGERQQINTVVATVALGAPSVADGTPTPTADRASGHAACRNDGNGGR